MTKGVFRNIFANEEEENGMSLLFQFAFLWLLSPTYSSYLGCDAIGPRSLTRLSSKDGVGAKMDDF